MAVLPAWAEWIINLQGGAHCLGPPMEMYKGSGGYPSLPFFIRHVNKRQMQADIRS